MNNITCGIAKDLLPLYIDNYCSEDSRQALEEHLKTCENCEKEYTLLRKELHMDSTALNSEAPEAIATTLSQKVRKRKLWSMVIMTIGVLISVFFLFYLGKALSLISNQGGAVYVNSTENTVNLSETNLTCLAKDIDKYTFVTNSTRIIVKTDDTINEPVTVTLWSGIDNKYDIMVSRLESGQKTRIFTNLSSQTYYSITLDNEPDIQMTVSQRLTFWEAFVLALQGY